MKEMELTTIETTAVVIEQNCQGKPAEILIKGLTAGPANDKLVEWLSNPDKNKLNITSIKKLYELHCPEKWIIYYTT